MLIGIDGNEANVKERVGVNVWAYELLKQFKETRDKRQETRDLKFVIYLSKPPIKDMPEESESFRYRIIGPGKFWTRWRLPLDLYLHNPRPDVFLSFSHYAPKWAPMPRVVSIMDLSFLKFPEAFKPSVLWQLKHWTEESIKKAIHIIAISEFTKQEIIKYYNYPANKITVVYPGISKIFKRGLGKYEIRGKYILFVGTLQPKKNLPRLLEAFKLVGKDCPDLELVIVGKTWRQFKQIKNLPFLAEKIKFIGYVSDQDMPQLLAKAECLVFPSLYEGFGIPAIEAMNVGVPVATSNTTSLPEIIGDSGVFFDPLNIQEIACGINKVLSMSLEDRQEMIKKGMIRARQFNWEKSAKKVLDILINER